MNILHWKDAQVIGNIIRNLDLVNREKYMELIVHVIILFCGVV